MIELFESLSTYIDKFQSYVAQLIDGVKNSVVEIKLYLSLLPVELYAVGLTIIVFLVIFRLLGR